MVGIALNYTSLSVTCKLGLIRLLYRAKTHELVVYGGRNVAMLCLQL
jgi:hypothetical protein